MKKFLFITLLFAMSILAGCEDDIADVTETKSVPAEACWFEITVTATGGVWSVNKKPDWIHLDPEKGIVGNTVVDVHVEANSESKQRRGYIRFSFGDVLEVVQSGN